jgi:hypothetical protein
MSVCLSVRVQPLGWHWTEFNWSWYFSIFLKFFEKNNFHYNLTTITGGWHEDRYTFMITSRSFHLRIKNVSGNICRENQNTLFSITFFKSCLLFDNVEKILYSRGGHSDSMAHAQCYKHAPTHTHTHTLTICHTHCFSKTTTVAPKLLNVTLYVHCLSVCLFHGPPRHEVVTMPKTVTVLVTLCIV